MNEDRYILSLSRADLRRVQHALGLMVEECARTHTFDRQQVEQAVARELPADVIENARRNAASSADTCAAYTAVLASIEEQERGMNSAIAALRGDGGGDEGGGSDIDSGSLRCTGRTTRMLEAAARAAEHGPVAVVAHSQQFAEQLRRWAERVLSSTSCDLSRIKFITHLSLPDSDDRSRISRDHVIFWDHTAAELRAKQIEQQIDSLLAEQKEMRLLAHRFYLPQNTDPRRTEGGPK